MAHDTVIGINAKLSDTRQQGRLVIGYDRDYVTIIPKSVTVSDGNGGTKKDVMASIGCNRAKVKGARLVQYSDFVVTGDAAVSLASKLNGTTTVFDCEVTDSKDKEGGS
ncbi:hypothetical protein [Shimia sp. NS0008-38b]|uniref:hypothetical protein n=1 Tax=Shimia sp. NS0008-38b TaxID=3127653 RepID=UPI00333ECDE2